MTASNSKPLKTVLCFGRYGQLAQTLTYVCPESIQSIRVGRDVLIADENLKPRLSDLIERHKPDCLLNVAAYTDVEAAEIDPAVFTVNYDLVVLLGQLAAQYSIPLLHISTDYVFAGDQADGYDAADHTAPVNNYGRSKLAGEQGLLDIPRLSGAVVRTSWLYSPWGHNFMLTMLKRFETGTVQVVNDQFGCPTSALSLARALWALSIQYIEAPTPMQILHWSDQGKASWFDFAKAIALQAYQEEMLPQLPDINPVSSDAFPTKARRPTYSLLLPSPLFDEIGVQRRPWQAALSECLLILKRIQNAKLQHSNNSV